MFSKKELEMFRKTGVKVIEFHANEKIAHIEFFPFQTEMMEGLTPKQLKEFNKDPTPEEAMYSSSE